MLNSIEEYLSSQEEAFAQCEDFLPKMEVIKEADKIGKKVLNFIDSNVKNIDMDAINSLDVIKIVDELGISVNEQLDGDALSNIYKEIDDTFKQGGRISLEDYLDQGRVVLSDMLNELRGTVDYSIDYSEKQLKEEEKKGFERFQLVMSMQNLKETEFCFDLNPAGKSFMSKCDNYLGAIGDALPYAGSIEEKIGELNTSVLLFSSLESLGCKVSDKVELNNFLSDKFNDIIHDLSKYHEDSNIRNMFSELKSTIDKYKDNEIVSILSVKIDKVDEKIFENVNEKNSEYSF